MHKRSEKFVTTLIAALLVLVPFHAFLTVWAASAVGHYTLLRAWTLGVLLVLSAIAGWFMYSDKTVWHALRSSQLMRAIGIYALLTVVLALTGWATGGVSTKAMVYGVVLNLRFLWFFTLVWILARKATWLKGNWLWLVLIPGAVVVAFAVLQYLVLPVDFLKHFGYGPDTIPASATINNDPNYIRVASTLRGSNPLGAYLVLLLSVLGALWLRVKVRNKLFLALYAGVAAVALLFSFSRSAWIGVVVAALLVCIMAAQSRKARIAVTVAAVGILLVSGGAFAIARHNLTVQNAVLHTSDKSEVPRSSNQQRLHAQKESLDLVRRHPFGMGVGSAGPASVYNTKDSAVISDNYFLQIAVEVGVIGLGMFVAITVLVAKELWRLRSSLLAVVLLSSLAGLTVVNLLSHAWTDDTLAYLWWGLAGIALAPAVKANTRKIARNKTPHVS